MRFDKFLDWAFKICIVITFISFIMLVIAGIFAIISEAKKQTLEKHLLDGVKQERNIRLVPVFTGKNMIFVPVFYTEKKEDSNDF